MWWDSGYGGKTDDEAMIGDGDGEQDGHDGLLFLDKILLLRKLNIKTDHALDCGAGVGRITKHILLVSRHTFIK